MLSTSRLKLNHKILCVGRSPLSFLNSKIIPIDFTELDSHLDFNLFLLPLTESKQIQIWIQKIADSNPKAIILIFAKKITGELAQALTFLNKRNILFSLTNESELIDNIQRAHDRMELNLTISKDHVVDNTTQKRLSKMNHQIEALQKALLAVHAAKSVSEIESLLFKSLASTLNLNWVRVFLFSNDHLERQLSRIEGQKLYKSPLKIDSRALGNLVLARSDNKEFTKTEIQSLLQISESVALALDRLAKLDQAETLKFQWDSTFDAISEPLCLTDEKFNIIRTNKAFLNVTGFKASQCLGQNCFISFCGDRAPLQVSKSPNSLVLERTQIETNEIQYFEVHTQRIRTHETSKPILMVMFRDLTEQRKIEKQIFESSKMAELGTIGSSIAHDINNPLGGMINFIQLIKMDLPKTDPHYADIEQMEGAGRRCKEIVENLLRFSRKPDTSQAKSIDLIEILEQVLKIIELQTRPLGILIDWKAPAHPLYIMGEPQILSQALTYVLQNSFEAVAEKLNSKPGYKGQIKINNQKINDNIVLTVTDNGVGIQPENQSKIINPLFSTKNNRHGLGLTLAFQIVADHNGTLEIFSQPNVGTTVKISFINV